MVWGAEGSSRSDGYGLSKIVKYHNEVLHQIDNIINEGELKRDNKGRLNIEYKNSIIGLRDNWKGEKNKNHWIITSYSKR
ncbi:TPA: DUF3519 domain-containing protein [Campylobacter jejuni subsp. jejuni]